MIARSIRVRGAAGAGTVWDRYAYPARWPQWSPQLRRVSLRTVRSPGPSRLVDARPEDVLYAGLTGVVTPIAGPGARFRVEEVDADARTWSWTVWRGPIRLRLEHGVEPDGETWLTVRGPLPLVLGYLPLARVALRRLVR